MPTDSHAEALASALARCEREPVHAPGAIQPVGVLLCLDATLENILQVSDSVTPILGLAVGDVLAGKPEALLGKALVSRLRRINPEAGQAYSESIRRQFQGKTRRYRLLYYRSDERAVIELEALNIGSETRALSLVNGWLSPLSAAASEQALLDALCRAIRAITGFDRVMVYCFDEVWNGSVIAEDRAQEADSFLDHHFPASDLPAQVRALYLRNPVRYIADAAMDPSPLLAGPEQAQGPALDMSPGALRAVASVHRHYLASMGVSGSLSLAIESDQGLWGLVACHALSPRPLSPAVRDAARALVQVATQRLFLLHARAEAGFMQILNESREMFSERRGIVRHPVELVTLHGPRWLSLFQALYLAPCVD